MKTTPVTQNSISAKKRKRYSATARVAKAAVELGIASESARTFTAISDPENVGNFSIDAAVKAFARITVKP